MDTAAFVSYVLVGLICFFVGFVFSRHRRDGVMKINTSDPDKDVYSLVLDIPLSEIPNKHLIILDVEIE